MTKRIIASASELGVGPDRVISFINSEWQRPVALSLPWFYDWQFRSSPSSSGQDKCVLAAGETGGIVGFMGVTQRAFVHAGTLKNGVELTTWTVSKRARGSGLGWAMIEYLQAHYEVIVGMGVTDAALAIYKQLGFMYVHHLPRFVRVHHLDRIAPISEISPLGMELINKGQTRRPVRFEVSAVGADIAAEIASRHARTFNGISRAQRELQWRYWDHPVYEYQAFEVRANGAAAVVVMRLEDKPEIRLVHVVDVFGDLAAYPGVVAFVDEFCLDIEADASDVLCLSPQESHHFWSAGWFSTLDDGYVQVPNVFYPIEMRRPPTTSLILWAKDDMESLNDVSRLHVTKGDCDIDRPTLQYFEVNGIPTDRPPR